MAICRALLRKEKDADFGVDFPDFPGCITAGETLEEAHRRGPEALRLHIKCIVEEGEQLPEPSSFEDIMADPANECGMPFPQKVPDNKTKRISITVPEPHLEVIDAYARRLGLSRSASLVEAAKEVMGDGSLPASQWEGMVMSQPRILIGEDEPLLREDLSIRLNASGCRRKSA